MDEFEDTRAQALHAIYLLKNSRGTPLLLEGAVGETIRTLEKVATVLSRPDPRNMQLWKGITMLLLAVKESNVPDVRKYWAPNYKEFDEAIDMLLGIVGPVEEIKL